MMNDTQSNVAGRPAFPNYWQLMCAFVTKKIILLHGVHRSVLDHTHTVLPWHIVALVSLFSLYCLFLLRPSICPVPDC